MGTSKKSKPSLGAPLVGMSKVFPLGSSILKIVIGSGNNTREFGIHEALLTSRSKFFAKAMGKGWKEAEEKVVKLPEDDPDTFALYEQLIYTGNIPAFSDAPDRFIIDNYGETMCTEPKLCRAEYESLVRLYVLAEKLQDIKTKNSAVDAIIAKLSHKSESVTDNHYEGPCLPSTKAIRIMYEQTPSHCPGRQALVDCYVWYGQPESHSNYDTYDEKVQRQFLEDLTKDLMQYRQQSTKNLPQNNLQRYHGTESEWECMVEYWKIKCYRKR